MVKCIVKGCSGTIRLVRRKGEPLFECNVCGAGPSGTAKTDESAARRRLAEVRRELKRLQELLGEPRARKDDDDRRASCAGPTHRRASR